MRFDPGSFVRASLSVWAACPDVGSGVPVRVTAWAGSIVAIDLARRTSLPSSYGRGVRAFPLLAKPPYAASKAPLIPAQGCTLLLGCSGVKPRQAMRGDLWLGSEAAYPYRVSCASGCASVSVVCRRDDSTAGPRRPSAPVRPARRSSGCFARFRYRVGSRSLCPRTRRARLGRRMKIKGLVFRFGRSLRGSRPSDRSGGSSQGGRSAPVASFWRDGHDLHEFGPLAGSAPAH